MLLQKTVPFSSPSRSRGGRMRYASTTGYVRGFKKWICIRHRRWRLWGVCNTPPQPGTYGPSKNCPVFVPFGTVGWGIFDTPLQLGMCDPSKYRCNSLTGYVWPFKKLSRFHPLRGRGVGRIRYAPTIGYVCPFEIPIRSPDRVRARIQKMDLYTPPSVAFGGAYSIRPYNRVRTILRNTDVIPRPGMCGLSKNCPVFVPFGAVCGAYSIRPYNQARISLQKTVLFSSPTGPRGGRIRYAPTIGYVRSFEIPMQFPNRVRMALLKTVSFSSLLGLSVGRIQYASTTGYV